MRWIPGHWPAKSFLKHSTKPQLPFPFVGRLDDVGINRWTWPLVSVIRGRLRGHLFAYWLPGNDITPAIVSISPHWNLFKGAFAINFSRDHFFWVIWQHRLMQAIHSKSTTPSELDSKQNILKMSLYTVQSVTAQSLQTFHTDKDQVKFVLQIMEWPWNQVFWHYLPPLSLHWKQDLRAYPLRIILIEQDFWGDRIIFCIFLEPARLSW